jgi:cation transport ATPase
MPLLSLRFSPSFLPLAITLLSLLAMLTSLLLPDTLAPYPLWVILFLGGIPLLWEILRGALKGDFGADILAAIGLVTALWLAEYMAATLIVLMLASGQALEAYAMRKASSVLAALAARMPAIAHRKQEGHIYDISLSEIKLGDELVVYPHETAPVDGVVISGHGSMDESYLTGEPYRVTKAAGSSVLSGAINGDAMLVIRAEKLPQDSRYATIMQVMEEAEQKRPKLRRLADRIGAAFAPLALVMAVAAWVISGDVTRFLAVLVVATPCPLLIAIPVAIISAISLAAKHGIIIRDPTVLERLPTCTTAIFDKTGTLTYGRPELTEILVSPQFEKNLPPAQGAARLVSAKRSEDGSVGLNGISVAAAPADYILTLAASLERYSKHPLAVAILEAAQRHQLYLPEATEVSERAGQGLSGMVKGQRVTLTSRHKLLAIQPQLAEILPPVAAGLECVVLIDDIYAATLRLRDAPRTEGQPFIHHLAPSHHFTRVMLVSGDRESEVQYLAELLGITEIRASQSPEEKLAIVRAETAKAPTLFMGDGINDAPALTAATVGLAFGQHSSVTSEAAGAVILDNTLSRVDELMHLSEDMRRIALQSALGGMLASLVGMILAAAGYLSPVEGALLQEAIDVIAILAALRLAFRKKLEADV